MHKVWGLAQGVRLYRAAEEGVEDRAGTHEGRDRMIAKIIILDKYTSSLGSMRLSFQQSYGVPAKHLVLLLQLPQLLENVEGDGTIAGGVGRGELALQVSVLFDQVVGADGASLAGASEVGVLVFDGLDVFDELIVLPDLLVEPGPQFHVLVTELTLLLASVGVVVVGRHLPVELARGHKVPGGVAPEMVGCPVPMLVVAGFCGVVAAEGACDFVVDVSDFFDGFMVDELLGGDHLDDFVDALLSVRQSGTLPRWGLELQTGRGFLEEAGRISVRFFGSWEVGGVFKVGSSFFVGGIVAIVHVGCILQLQFITQDIFQVFILLMNLLLRQDFYTNNLMKILIIQNDNQILQRLIGLFISINSNPNYFIVFAFLMSFFSRVIRTLFSIGWILKLIWRGVQPHQDTYYTLQRRQCRQVQQEQL